MASITLGSACMDVDQDLSNDDVAVLTAAFDQLKQTYGSLSDEALARAVFFNWVPGIEADGVVAAAVEQIGAHG